jgi:amidase
MDREDWAFDGVEALVGRVHQGEVSARELVWNSTGQPAASIPAGMSANGLPLAVQLIARPHDEPTLLAVAAQLEQARPWPAIARAALVRPPLG